MDGEIGCEKCKGFNYCFWGKLLVAIPAFPIIVFGAASFFDDLLLQSVAAALAGYGTVWLAIKIDKMPQFSKKIFKRKR